MSSKGPVLTQEEVDVLFGDDVETGNEKEEEDIPTFYLDDFEPFSLNDYKSSDEFFLHLKKLILLIAERSNFNIPTKHKRKNEELKRMLKRINVAMLKMIKFLKFYINSNRRDIPFINLITKLKLNKIEVILLATSLFYVTDHEFERSFDKCFNYGSETELRRVFQLLVLGIDVDKNSVRNILNNDNKLFKFGLLKNLDSISDAESRWNRVDAYIYSTTVDFIFSRLGKTKINNKVKVKTVLIKGKKEEAYKKAEKISDNNISEFEFEDFDGIPIVESSISSAVFKNINEGKSLFVFLDPYLNKKCSVQQIEKFININREHNLFDLFICIDSFKNAPDNIEELCDSVINLNNNNEHPIILDDVVLDEQTHEQIVSFINAVRAKSKVYEDWGFGQKNKLGRSISALFMGPSGVGKTMCAQAIANQLNLELTITDFSKIYNKFVGETEKAIVSIFRSIDPDKELLLIDECESLFATRTYDNTHWGIDQIRYTDILLTELEKFEGIVILTTNLSDIIDKSFERRIGWKIEFKNPDKKIREKIWRKSIPEKCPVSADIDFEILAEKYEMTGGIIKNVVMKSAFRAANNGQIIIQQIIEQIADREILLCPENRIGFE